MKNPARLLRISLAVLVLGILPTILVPPPAAQAASISPGLPDPLVALPKLASGAGGHYLGTKYAAVVAKALLGMTKDPRFIAAAKSVQAGIATPAETALVTAGKAKFKLPAFKVGALKPGALGVAMLANDLMVWVGHGTAEALGVDVNGLVCGEKNEFVAFASQVDCGPWKAAEDYRANQDQPVGVTGGKICDVVTGACAQLLGIGYKGVAGQAGSYDYFCFKTSFVGGVGAGLGLQSTNGSGTLSLNPTTVSSWTCEAFTTAGKTGYATTPLEVGERPVRYWFGSPETGPSADVGVAASNPPRQWKCVITLMDDTVYTKLGASFYDDDATIPKPDCPEFPLELPVRNTTIWKVGGGTDSIWWNEDTTPEYQSQATNYPECMGGTCVVDLVKVGTGSCLTTPAPCADWFTDPDKATNYTCKLGTNVVGLDQCTSYAPYFKPGAKTTTAPYGDPVTGEPLEGSGPGLGGLSDPMNEEGECYPSGWAVFNPVEWVLKPIKCAFIPRASVIAQRLAGVTSSWEMSSPGQMIRAIAALEFVAPGEGCEGVTVNAFGWIPGANIGAQQFLPACPGDFFHDVAGYFKVFLVGVFGIAGYWGIRRNVAGIFGYGSGGAAGG